MSRNFGARPAPQFASFSNVAEASEIQLTDIEDFAYRFEHAALEPDSTKWSNLPELIDLFKLQVERIPKELFAPETIKQPKYIEDISESNATDCQVVLAVFRCGNYAFFTAQCWSHFVTTVESNAKPVEGCNPQLVKERYFVPYRCGQDTCPVCYELHESESVLKVHQRKRSPN